MKTASTSTMAGPTVESRVTRQKQQQQPQLAGPATMKTGALLLSLLTALLLQLHGDLAAAQNSQKPQASATTTPAKPLWHRPGCYQVGHTRTISIPGCVKFNLSTNACRGYCLSFSIPAAEDIGPPPPDEGSFDGLLEASELALTSNKQNNEPTASERLLKRRVGSLISLLEADQQLETGAQTRLQAGQLEQLAVASAFSSPSRGEKRDVISVGQCCNMMETEDVTVNLRCGFNETRRLVFKSAKTCECFFCKHV